MKGEIANAEDYCTRWRRPGNRRYSSLVGCSFKVLVLECAKPAAIRRQVALCEAVYQGSAQVEGLTARLINSMPEADAVWEHDEVPVLVDEAADSVHAFAPDIVIDALLPSAILVQAVQWHRLLLL